MNHDIVHRMKSIKQTVHISSAQKLVASSHIGKARKALLESEAYHENVRRVISDILRHSPEAVEHYFKGRGKKPGALVLSANKGLAGGYNSNVLHFAENYAITNPVHYMIVLGQARNQMQKKGFPVDAAYDEPLEPPSMFVARELGEKIMNKLLSGDIDSFDVI